MTKGKGKRERKKKKRGKRHGGKERKCKSVEAVVRGRHHFYAISTLAGLVRPLISQSHYRDN